MNNQQDEVDFFSRAAYGVNAAPSPQALKSEAKSAQQQEELDFFNRAAAPQPEQASPSWMEQYQKDPGVVHSAMASLAKGGLKYGSDVLNMITGKAPMNIAAEQMGITPEGSTQNQLFDPEQRNELLKQVLPSRETAPYKAMERVAPLMLGGKEDAIRAGIGAILGQGAEELGFGPLTQAAAESSAFVLPALAKLITPTAAQKPLVDALRQMGVDEDAITAAIQSPTKQSLISKVASRGKNTQDKLAHAQENIGKLYQGLQKHPSASRPFKNEAAIKNEAKQIFDSFGQVITDKIEKDFNTWFNNPATLESSLIFKMKLNDAMAAGVPHKVGVLKGPLKKGFESISPEVAETVSTLDKAYGNQARLAKSLAKTQATEIADIIGGGGGLTAIAGSLAHGNVPAAAATAGTLAATAVGRKGAAEYLLNPRFQNLGLQSVEAAKRNKEQILSNMLRGNQESQ